MNDPMPTSRLRAHGLPLLVFLLAAAMAWPLFAASLAGDDAWRWMTHDRHQHYLYGLNLAQDVRDFDLGRLRRDLDALRVWGPLYSGLEFAVQVVAGPDHRLAALPSLAAWVATVLLGFLVARRMLPAHGDAAGLAAAAVLAALPAYRAYAADVMLESVGAALTLWVLHRYLVAVQELSPRAGGWLALSLIALFLLKYNYWLIAVIGLTGAEFARRPAAWLGFARDVGPRVPPIVIRELKNPLSWIAFLLLSSATWVWLGRRGQPHNLFTFGAIALLTRLLVWWRREGRELSFQLDPCARPVLVWHGFAAAVWFAMPNRLGFFLWYLSPANSEQKFRSGTLTNGFWYYLAALRDDYCAWPWQLAALLALVALAVVLSRTLRPGSVGVFAVLAVGALLTMQHAMTKYRHAHTWAGVAWVVAAVGLFAAVSLVGRRVGTALAAGLALLVVGLHAPAYLAPGRAQEGGSRPDLANPLAVTDAYLPALADARHTTILSNLAGRALFAWTFIERHGRTNFATDIRHYQRDYERDPVRLQAWLEATPSDALVLVEVGPRSPYAHEMAAGAVDLTAMKRALEGQAAFARAGRWELPDGVSVTLWRKENGGE